MPSRKKRGPYPIPRELATSEKAIEFYKKLALAQKQSDFANYHQPGDNIYGTPTGQGNRPTPAQCQAFMQSTIGVGRKLTEDFAQTMVLNKFSFVEIGTENIVRDENSKRIFRFMRHTDMWNQTADGMSYERGIGSSHMIKYWKEDLSDDLQSDPPPGPPVKFQSLPVTYVAPVNTYDTKGIDYTPEKWKLQGGVINPSNINEGRQHPWITRRIPGETRGLSVFEPMWLTLMCYYNSMIFLTRGISKWGNSVPAIKMGKNTPTREEYDRYLEIAQLFVKNNIFIVGKDDEVSFFNPQLGQGMAEYVEFLKEDISGGSSIPLNILFGRSESGGIGGEGALTMERYYLHKVSLEQSKISDDILLILEEAEFDVDDYDIMWNLSLQKTTEQRKRERSMELQIEMQEEQLKQMKLQTKVLRVERDQMVVQGAAEQLLLTGVLTENEIATVEDFIRDNDILKKKRQDFMKLFIEINKGNTDRIESIRTALDNLYNTSEN